MSTAEMAGRVVDHVRREAWRRRQVRPDGRDCLVVAGVAGHGPVALPPGTASAVPAAAGWALVSAADELLAGRWEIFGVERDDLVAPDWFVDPVTGRRAPDGRYAFDIDHRSEEQTGNVKQVWELSRHHHLTVLSAAWFLTGEARYAQRVDCHLRSWWQENQFLSGVHWTSGIEVAIRLISWTWVRRLLDGWPGCSDLFEGNDHAVRQVYRHQQYLSAFRSRGSSANNHVLAEAAGQLVSTCAFGWFPESGRWGVEAAKVFERELERNTFPSGVNRELASEYHCFVADLGLVAAVEAEAAGRPLSQLTWARLVSMIDVAAAVVDERLAGPRQGDGDEGRALVVDAPGGNPWSSLLVLGASLCGRLPWWPVIPPADVRTTVLVALAGRSPRGVSACERPPRRPAHFADAGLTVLRSAPADGPEIWCRCDGGPHGYLAIAAHAHADALAVEVRVGGIDVLSDPGTYCYHGEPGWRSYFRSTIGHNTLELGGRDQSISGGPFLWLRHASAIISDVEEAAGGVGRWSAHHDGYETLDPPAVHRRTVQLEPGRRLVICDRVECDGCHPWRLAFHLGPSVTVTLDGRVADLGWPAEPDPGSARLELPPELHWTAHFGQTDPILGWYAEGFGRKRPAVTLVGSGRLGPGTTEVRTVLRLGGFPR